MCLCVLVPPPFVGSTKWQPVYALSMQEVKGKGRGSRGDLHAHWQWLLHWLPLLSLAKLLHCEWEKRIFLCYYRRACTVWAFFAREFLQWVKKIKVVHLTESYGGQSRKYLEVPKVPSGTKIWGQVPKRVGSNTNLISFSIDHRPEKIQWKKYLKVPSSTLQSLYISSKLRPDNLS